MSLFIVFITHVNHFLLTWPKTIFTFAVTFCIWYFISHSYNIYLLSHHFIPIILKSNLFNLCKFHSNDDSVSMLCNICNFSWGLCKLGLLAKIHNKIFQGTFQLKWCLTSQSITFTGACCSLSKLPSPGWNLHFIC